MTLSRPLLALGALVITSRPARAYDTIYQPRLTAMKVGLKPVFLGIALSSSLMLTSHPAVAQSPVPITELAVLWEVNVGQNGATDYMTSVNSAERDQYPFLGAMAYIQAEGSTAPLFRLFDGSFDHMDSSTAGEGGYETQGVLGSP